MRRPFALVAQTARATPQGLWFLVLLSVGLVGVAFMPLAWRTIDGQWGPEPEPDGARMACALHETGWYEIDEQAWENVRWSHEFRPLEPEKYETWAEFREAIIEIARGWEEDPDSELARRRAEGGFLTSTLNQAYEDERAALRKRWADTYPLAVLDTIAAGCER